MSALPEPPISEERVDLVPLKPDDARRLARYIVEYGMVDVSSDHAKKAMDDDELTMPDLVNILRGGVFDPPELINGELRYRAQTKRMCFVIVFRSRERLRVVTAWRNR